MPTNSEKIEGNTLKINTLETKFDNLKDNVCPVHTQRMEKLEEELEKVEEKISANEKEIVERTTTNEKEIVEARNSLNLIAQEVKELLILRNKINTVMWRVIIGIIVSLILYLLSVHGQEVLSNISVKLGM